MWRAFCEADLRGVLEWKVSCRYQVRGRRIRVPFIYLGNLNKVGAWKGET